MVLERRDPVPGLVLRFQAAVPRAFATALEADDVAVERVDVRVCVQDPDGTTIQVD